MSWLLLEILAFVVAAAGFGVVIGLGLSAAGLNRKAVGRERAHQGLLDQIQALETTQRVVEVKAEARSAAEAAVRGDLEGRLLEIEATAAEYRARAEAAERRMRAMQVTDYSAPVTPELAASAHRAEVDQLKAVIAEAEAKLAAAEAERDAAVAAADARARDAEAVHAADAREIESLRRQVTAAERVRAKSEAELAVAHARAEAVMRSAAALMGGSIAPSPVAQTDAPPAPAPAGHAPTAGHASSAPVWDPPLPTATPAAANRNLPIDAANEPGDAPANGNAKGNGNGNGNGNRGAVGTQEVLLDEHDRPPGLKAPRGGLPDDLRRIRGIGPRNEGVLNALGLYHYEQIASLSVRNVTWLDSYFRFPGRIEREDWVGQAKALVAQQRRAEPSDKVHPDDAGF